MPSLCLHAKEGRHIIKKIQSILNIDKKKNNAGREDKACQVVRYRDLPFYISGQKGLSQKMTWSRDLKKVRDGVCG